MILLKKCFCFILMSCAPRHYSKCYGFSTKRTRQMNELVKESESIACTVLKKKKKNKIR